MKHPNPNYKLVFSIYKEPQFNTQYVNTSKNYNAAHLYLITKHGRRFYRACFEYPVGASAPEWARDLDTFATRKTFQEIVVEFLNVGYTWDDIRGAKIVYEK